MIASRETEGGSMSDQTEGQRRPRPESDRGRKTRNVFSPTEARQGMIVFKGPRELKMFFASIVVALIVAAVIVLIFG
jgi:hypothetical protein